MNLLIFALLSFVNVMLQTSKSILTVKSTRLVASIANAVAFGFYVVVIKQLAGFDIPTVVLVTICTNLIGVWLSICILDKFKKDQLWRVTATIPVNEKLFFTDKVSYTKVIDASGKNTIVDFYCQTREETELVMKDIRKIKGARYSYTVAGKLEE